MKKVMKIFVLLIGTLFISQSAFAFFWFGAHSGPHHRRNYYAHGYRPYHRRGQFNLVFDIGHRSRRVGKWEDVQESLEELYQNDENTQKAFEKLQDVVKGMQEDIDNLVKDVKNLIKEVGELQEQK